MKLNKGKPCYELEFTREDLREALVDYYKKKCEVDPSLRASENEMPEKCAMLVEVNDWDNFDNGTTDTVETIEDNPLSMKIRWVNRPHMTAISVRNKNRGVSMGCSVRGVPDSCSSIIGESVSIRFDDQTTKEMLVKWDENLKEIGTSAKYYSIGGRLRPQDCYTCSPTFEINAYAKDLAKSKKNLRESLTLEEEDKCKKEISKKCREENKSLFAEIDSGNWTAEKVTPSVNLYPCSVGNETNYMEQDSHGGDWGGWRDASNEVKTKKNREGDIELRNTIVQAMGVSAMLPPPPWDSSWEESVNKKEGTCGHIGCSKEAWERPNGDKLFCKEHETEEYTYKNKKGGLDLL